MNCKGLVGCANTEVAYKIMHFQLPDFESSPWQHADKNVVKLVSNLLASKHHYRLRLDKVAKHPWVMQNCGGQQYTFVDVTCCT
jgi:hypothetical protein